MNHCLIWDLKSVAAKAATAAMVPTPLIPNTLYTQHLVPYCTQYIHQMRNT